ncbi:MAG: hypothetical protein H7210_07345 [Pyrinomonadaceae bacterium]|nr:hypothetical protein [Phycisphaerales bacterium]
MQPRPTRLRSLVSRAGPLAAISLCLLAQSRQCRAQVIIDLGVLAPRLDSSGTAINADGTVAVGTSSVNDHAFRWTLSGGMQDLGILPYNGMGFTYGMGCSADGSIACGTNLNTPQGFGERHAFRWSSPAGLQEIGPYFPTSYWTDCNGVSGDGLTFYGQTRTPVTFSVSAYRWTVVNGFQLLGNITPQGLNSNALDSTPDGSAICGAAEVNNSTGIQHAFRWTAATGMVDISAALSPSFSTANAISHDGLIVAGTADLSGNLNTYHAFIWRDLGNGNSSITDLGTPTGTSQSYVNDLSGDGTVVVGKADVSYVGIWTQQLGWRNLNSWLPQIGINLTGWTLQRVSQLSADGTAMVGTGLHNGLQRAFVIRGIPCHHAPTILTQSDAISTCEGGAAAFFITAGGNYTGALTYQWKHNGAPLLDGVTPFGAVISGANTPNLTITNLSWINNGQYTVTVSNPCGSSTSSDTNLIVAQPPDFFTQPVDITLCPGGSGSLFAFPTVFGHGVNLQWYKRGRLGQFFPVNNGITPSGSQIGGATTDTLQFFLATSDLAGLYYCVITAPCGTAQTVTVQVSLFDPLVIENQSINTTVCPSGPFYASCQVTPVANGPFTYQWQREAAFNVFLDISNGTTNTWDGALPAMGALVHNATTPNLTIAGDTANSRWLAAPHAVRYRCRITDNCGTEIHTIPVQLTLCIADFDCDGNITSQDFFNFIVAFFSLLPEADLDHDGNVTSGDYFMFLAVFFTGCP